MTSSAGINTAGIDIIAIEDASDIVRVRGAARSQALKIGFGLADQTRLATAVSELARNIVVYAGSGACTIEDISTSLERRIRIVMEDAGPGITDIERAMQDGYSTGGGLGAGLPGTRRLMERFQIESQPGLTRITIEMARRRV